ncbi:MAG: hypothetical protein CSA68_12580 [Rhodobacterales bacterium]|nr:MAG: hypothetical protein CSA68_12580 [Rhodobacterales bacterium]
MTQHLIHGGLPADMTRYRLKLLLQQARVALGLSSGALKYLEFAIDNCQPSDFQQGRICAIWHSLERLAVLLGLSKRQITRIEAELVGAGLIKRTYPERKSRSGERVDGVIKRAAGINLAPLIERAEYIRFLVSRQMLAHEDRKQLCEHIQGLFRQIRDLDNADADEAATCILPRRRPTELSDIKKMQEVAEALEAVLADFSAVILSAEPMQRRAQPPEVDPVLLAAVGRAGNNLNQIARAMNTDRKAGRAIDLIVVRTLLMTLDRQLAEIVAEHSR